MDRSCRGEERNGGSLGDVKPHPEALTGARPAPQPSCPPPHAVNPRAHATGTCPRRPCTVAVGASTRPWGLRPEGMSRETLGQGRTSGPRPPVPVVFLEQVCHQPGCGEVSRPCPAVLPLQQVPHAVRLKAHAQHGLHRWALAPCGPLLAVPGTCKTGRGHWTEERRAGVRGRCSGSWERGGGLLLWLVPRDL